MSENKRVIEHKHKLDIKLTIILALFAIGVLAHAFAPAFEVKDAMASSCASQRDVRYEISYCMDGATIRGNRISTYC